MTFLPHHLGGHAHMTNLDIGALEYLINRYNAQSFLDIGCGPGDMVDYAFNQGLVSHGIDGDFTLKYNMPENFILHDYTSGPVELFLKYDIGWSCEFLEHVEEQYMDNYMDTFKYCRYIAVTHAFPGQGGHHHVNLQEYPYWVEKFASYGFVEDKIATSELRKASTMDQDYVRNSGLVFINPDVK